MKELIEDIIGAVCLFASLIGGYILVMLFV